MGDGDGDGDGEEKGCQDEVVGCYGQQGWCMVCSIQHQGYVLTSNISLIIPTWIYITVYKVTIKNIKGFPSSNCSQDERLENCLSLTKEVLSSF